MARLLQVGAETRGSNALDSLPTGTGSSIDTSVFRSGSASYQVNSGASGSSGRSITVSDVAFVAGRSYFARAYVQVGAAPAAAVSIFALDSHTKVAARLRTDGKVELLLNTVVQGSPSSVVITDGNWHRIELKGTYVATTSWNAGELVVDGVTVASASVTAFTGSNTSIVITFGWLNAGAGTNVIANFDDVALNDSTGSINNSYPGDGKVVLLLPTADTAKGTGWTDDNASTTSLFPSVVATPPAGIADTTTGGGGHQIRNATSNANVNYDATMSTYAAAGLVSGDTINAIIPYLFTGAPVTTGAKTGTVGVVSNPAISNVAFGAGGSGTAGQFWQGSTAGAFPTGWKLSPGTVTEAPTVTLGTAPVMRVTQVTASTRIAMVCFMGIYVEYTPAVVVKPKRFAQPYSTAHRRAALR